MSDQRKLRRAWERRGYKVTENGHGRVYDSKGRLVATYSMSPGSAWSKKQDWGKLSKPVVPHGIKRKLPGHAAIVVRQTRCVALMGDGITA